jgi:hypothetical protein
MVDGKKGPVRDRRAFYARNIEKKLNGGSYLNTQSAQNPHHLSTNVTHLPVNPQVTGTEISYAGGLGMNPPLCTP